MPSYVVAGASRGLGYEFIRHLAQDKSNVVVGLVRNKPLVEERLAKDGIDNVTIFQADITDIEALQAAAAEVARLAPAGLDYLINNAALVSGASALEDLTSVEENPKQLEKELSETFQSNIIGVAKTITAFLPLVKQSKTKKVITLSSGMADLRIINDFAVGLSAPYTVSKAALNALVAKYNVAYAPQGILFMSISPGVVDTSEGKTMSPEELEKILPMLESFKRYDPTFQGPMSPRESVEHVLKLADRATIASFGGKFVSHHGDENWL